MIEEEEGPETDLSQQNQNPYALEPEEKDPQGPNKKLIAGIIAAVVCVVLAVVVGVTAFGPAPDGAGASGSASTQQSTSNVGAASPSNEAAAGNQAGEDASATNTNSEAANTASATNANATAEGSAAAAGGASAEAGSGSVRGDGSSTSGSGTSGSASGSSATPAQPATITVYVYVDSSRAPGWGGCMAAESVTLPAGSSVYDALCATGVSVGGSSTYVSSINGLSEKLPGYESGSGWMYAVDGSFPGKACGRYKLYGGEDILWVYTLDMGNDL